MSALEDPDKKGGDGVFHWRQPVPMPAYLGEKRLSNLETLYAVA